MIGTLSKDEIERMLREHRFGRIACATDNRPYVIPMHYVYEQGSIYSFTHHGRKLDVMRAQPNVAFLVDHIESPSTWRTVMAEGLFEEVPDHGERHRILQNLAFGLGGMAADGTQSASDGLVVFRIAVQETSGRFERR